MPSVQLPKDCRKSNCQNSYCQMYNCQKFNCGMSNCQNSNCWMSNCPNYNCPNTLQPRNLFWNIGCKNDLRCPKIWSPCLTLFGRLLSMVHVIMHSELYSQGMHSLGLEAFLDFKFSKLTFLIWEAHQAALILILWKNQPQF